MVLSGENIGTDTPKEVVLVTGATGFIGPYLVDILKSTNREVRVYSRQQYSVESVISVPESNWFTGELSEISSLDEACRGVDTVYHLAGMAHSLGSDRQDLMRVNVLGTKNLFGAAVKNGVKKFVYFSSIHSSSPELSAYAESKREVERLLSSRNFDVSGMRIAVLRPATVYGVGMKGNLRTFVRLVLTGFLPLLPSFSSTFRMVSVRDLCRVAIEVSQNDYDDSRFVSYAVTDGELYTPNRIEEAVYSRTERGKPRWRLPKVFFYLAALVADLANRLGVKKNRLGLQLYKNLANTRAEAEDMSGPSYVFAPAATLESEIGPIIESLNKR